MTVTADVAIVGGGVIGLLTAREFSLAGARTVLIERNTVGQEASWAGGGILFPIYPWKNPETIISLCLKSLEIYPKLAEDLKDATGIDIELINSGMLVCNVAEDAETVAWCNTHAIQADFADQSEIQTLIPNLDSEIEQALWLPEVRQLRNPNLINALNQDLYNRGVSIFERQKVTQLVRRGARIQRLETTTNSYIADHYVLAAGAWTQTLLASDYNGPDISPAKGEMLLYKTRSNLLQQIILADGMYLIPRQDGHILVGSTLEFSGFDKHLTQTAKKTLQNFAQTIFPPLSQYPIKKHWAGLRPACASGIPIIGPDPTVENLSFNSGHFRNGLGMAPASAQLLVDLVLKRKTQLPAQPYALDAKR